MKTISTIIFFISIILISSKNVVIIGDSRICGMGAYVFGFDYTWHNQYYGTGSYMITTNPKAYGGHNVKVIAEVGASYYTFTNAGKEVYKGVYNILNASTKGTVVLMWLGVNNLDSGSTYNYYYSLAKQYKSFTFYAVSVTGVSSKSDISNDTIKRFNSNLKSKVSYSGLSNLKFKNILYNENPTQIYNSSSGKITFKVTDGTTDSYGIHYFADGYREIFYAMVAGI